MQEKACSFKEDKNNGKILDQVIDGVIHRFWSNLLTYEASIRHMKSVAELKSEEHTTVQFIKQKKLSNCRNYGRYHVFKPENTLCPEYGDTYEVTARIKKERQTKTI